LVQHSSQPPRQLSEETQGWSDCLRRHRSCQSNSKWYQLERAAPPPAHRYCNNSSASRLPFRVWEHSICCHVHLWFDSEWAILRFSEREAFDFVRRDWSRCQHVRFVSRRRRNNVIIWKMSPLILCSRLTFRPTERTRTLLLVIVWATRCSYEGDQSMLRMFIFYFDIVNFTASPCCPNAGPLLRAWLQRLGRTIYQAHGACGTAATSVSPPPTPAKARLRKLHSAPIKDLLSTGMDVESLRRVVWRKLPPWLHCNLHAEFRRTRFWPLSPPISSKAETKRSLLLANVTLINRATFHS